MIHRSDKLLSALFISPIQRSSHRVVSLASLSALLWGGSAILSDAQVWADQTSGPVFIAQQIVDGLPPPPDSFAPVPLPEEFEQELPSAEQFSAPYELPPAILEPQPQNMPLPTVVLDQDNPSMEYTDPTWTAVPASPPAIQPTLPDFSGQRYLVMVNGNSPLLLDQVRKVDSGAFVQTVNGRELIQAGLFDEAESANQQVQTLAVQGIGAEVIPVPGMADASNAMLLANQPTPTYNALPTLPSPTLMPVEPLSREVEFGQPVNWDSGTRVSQTYYSPGGTLGSIPGSTPYYIVVPGRSSEIRAISVRITQLAQGLRVQESSIEERETPLGPHVLVGPFIDRSTAFRWDEYFRTFGLDSRVYYRQGS